MNERMWTLAAGALALLLTGCSSADFTVAESRTGDSTDAIEDSATSSSAIDSAPAALDSAPSPDTSSHDSAPSIDSAPAVDSAHDSAPAMDSAPAVDSGPAMCAVDVDGDGYLDADSCKGGLDCDDKDPNAHFGQSLYFGVASIGKKIFDFNCNGVAEQEITAKTGVYPEPVGDGSTGSCYADRTDAWYLKVPACGETGQWPVSWTYVPPAPLKPASCNVVTEARVQRCR